ncbi:cation:proton antiporter [Aurantibacillus circumpalustris]|uniref:cation:proton antiporter n=1 Tax=Aurantibacillus circumpalustris TaxID=3036359 RepID=UPI00295A83EB|nr:sodium:proton antiporter [Aurantibacillus circumpalustris]
MTVFTAISIIITLSASLGYMNHRWLKLPSTIGVMILSLIVGVSLKIYGSFYPENIAPLRDYMNAFDFSSFVLDIILCFLLFAGALHVKFSELKDARATVISYATIGVLISTFLIGFLAYWILPLFGYHPQLIICLLFGALISPTDPIAVIGILAKYNVPKKLKVEIVGESLFNDGVGVVVFMIMYSVLQLGIDSLTINSLFEIFLHEVIGGLGVGLAVGYVGYRLMKSIDHYQSEVLISLSIVMGGYTLADFIHASGPLAMVVAGLLIGNQGKKEAMSNITAEYVDKFWELIDEICNTILFVLIGLEVFIIPLHTNYLLLGGVFIVITLLSRFISLVPSYLILNRKQDNKLLGLTTLTWGGLRGGISIALVLSLSKQTPYSEMFLVITFCIVLFSIVVQGLTVSNLLKRYK